MVCRRQTGHLGPLGTAMCTRGGRLVCTGHVSAGPGPIPRALPALRPSLGVWHDRLHTDVESREVRPRGAREALQGSGRPILRLHGQSSRQLRQLPFEIPPLELRQHGSEARHRGRVREGRAPQRAALRREQPLGPRLALVPDRLRLRCRGREGRREIRRLQPDEGRRQGQVVGRLRPPAVLWRSAFPR